MKEKETFRNPQERIEEIMQWTHQYQNTDTDKILFGKSPIPQELRGDVVRQLTYRSKMLHKYPLIGNKLYLPASITFEQSSSESTALHKRKYTNNGEIVTDGTGGLGIDFMALSQSAQKAMYIEQDPLFFQAGEFNLSHLCNPETKLKFFNGFLEDYLTTIIKEGTTLLYFDPARRDEKGSRTYALEDILPNPITICSELKKQNYTGKVLIKLSPMIDITDTLRQMPQLNSLEIISVGGEVKELLASILSLNDYRNEEEIKIEVTDLDKKGNLNSQFSGTLGEEHSLELPLAQELGEFLFIPHGGIFKSGLYKTLAHQEQLSLLHPNSHIYTGDELKEHFPGKTYRIKEIIPFSSAILKRLHKRFPIADFSARNFPLRPEQFYKKSKVKAGDAIRLFGTTLSDEKTALLVIEKC